MNQQLRDMPAAILIEALRSTGELHGVTVQTAIRHAALARLLSKAKANGWRLSTITVAMLEKTRLARHADQDVIEDCIKATSDVKIRFIHGSGTLDHSRAWVLIAANTVDIIADYSDVFEFEEQVIAPTEAFVRAFL